MWPKTPLPPIQPRTRLVPHGAMGGFGSVGAVYRPQAHRTVVLRPPPPPHTRRSCTPRRTDTGLTHEHSRRAVYGAGLFIYNPHYEAIFYGCHGSFASMAGEAPVMAAVRRCLGVESLVPLCCVVNEHDVLVEALACKEQHFGGGRSSANLSVPYDYISTALAMALRCATGGISLIDGPSQHQDIDSLVVRGCRLPLRTCARAPFVAIGRCPRCFVLHPSATRARRVVGRSARF